MTETISVITINYNNLKGLKRTFESVLSQTDRKVIQYIVVDGNSTDGSKEFLEANKEKIDILICEPDKGIYDAMNKGLHAAQCKYVWFVNSGDAIYNSFVTSKILPIIQAGIDVIFGDTMFIDSDGNELGLISLLKPQKMPKKLSPGAFRFGMTFCHQSVIVKKAISPDYNLHFKLASDIDWILNILKKKPSNVNSEIVMSAFETGGSSSIGEKKAWKERFHVLSKHYGFFPNLLAHGWIIIRRIIFKFKSKKNEQHK
jgi:glycosyltransferase involved in cell wall biosynthesis